MGGPGFQISVISPQFNYGRQHAQWSLRKAEAAAKKAAAEATTVRKREENVAPEQSARKEGAVTVEDLFAAIAQQKKACLSVIVKSDVHGSTEALVNSIKQIVSDKVDIRVISHGVGHISKSDANRRIKR